MKTEFSLSCSQQPLTFPYLKRDQRIPRLHHTSWRYILILSSYLRVCLGTCLFASGLPTKRPLIFPILHAPPISYVFIWSSSLCLVRSTYNEAARDAVPSSLVSLSHRPKYLLQQSFLEHVRANVPTFAFMWKALGSCPPPRKVTGRVTDKDMYDNHVLNERKFRDDMKQHTKKSAKQRLPENVLTLF
jgi:hypothetical protein